MATLATGSITVTFKAVCEEGVSVSVELDDDRNQGKTCFMPGDTAYIKVYTIPHTANLEVFTTFGSISAVGSYSESFPATDESSYITFAGTTESSVSKPIISGFSYNWIGSTYYSVSGVSYDEGSIQVRLSDPSADPERFAGVMEISYNTLYRSYALTVSSLGGRSEVPVLVLFIATLS